MTPHLTRRWPATTPTTAAIFLAASLMAAFPLRAASPEDTSRSAEGDARTLVALVQPEPTVLTAAFNTNNPVLVVSSNLFDGLLAYDKDQQPQPSLALRWKVSPDYRSIRFELRPGVKWHDGKPFTSADVAYSALEVWKKQHGRGRVTFATLASVDTPDPLTAIFRFSAASPAVLSALSAAESQVLPRHLYEGTDIQKNPANLKPVGTGPFRFKDWKKGQYIELERNPDYWDTGKPKLDRLIFQVIPDVASRAVALERGDVAYAVNSPVPLADVARLSQQGQLVIDRRGYGWASNYLLTEVNLRNAHLKVLKVRQAIAHAIDKQALIETVWYGYGKPATGPIATSLPKFYTADVQKYPFDIAAANRLLDEAGFPRADGGNGVRFSLKASYLPFGDPYRNTAEFLRQSLRRVGIDVVISNQDLAGYMRQVYTSLDYDLNVVQLAAFTDPQIGVHRTLWSKAASPGVPYVNASGYASPAMDAVIEASRTEVDPKKRQAQFHELQRIAARDLPIIPLIELEQFTVYSKKLRGVNTGFDGQISSLKDVSIAP